MDNLNNVKMEEIKIKKSKMKFLLASSGVISFIFLSFQLIFDSPIESNFTVKQIVGILSLIFWLGLLLWGIKRFIKRQYGLILNEKGLLNNSDEIENVFIPWESIIKVEELEQTKTDKVGVFIKELSEYKSVNNSKKHLRQIKRNLKRYEVPIIISPNRMQKTSQELVSLINDFRKNK